MCALGSLLGFHVSQRVHDFPRPSSFLSDACRNGSGLQFRSQAHLHPMDALHHGASHVCMRGDPVSSIPFLQSRAFPLLYLANCFVNKI